MRLSGAIFRLTGVRKDKRRPCRSSLNNKLNSLLVVLVIYLASCVAYWVLAQGPRKPTARVLCWAFRSNAASPNSAQHSAARLSSLRTVHSADSPPHRGEQRGLAKSGLLHLDQLLLVK